MYNNFQKLQKTDWKHASACTRKVLEKVIVFRVFFFFVPTAKFFMIKYLFFFNKYYINKKIKTKFKH